MLKGKKILIGITGSIAAYKIPFLVRLLIKEGAEVKILLSRSARDFVTPLTLSTLSGNPVITGFFKEDTGEWSSHVEFGNWADLYLIAPVTANTLGKMANGLADNLLVATYLAAKCPVFFAPAMDLDMFRHPSTAKNIEILKSFGNKIIEPASGELASGLYGEGRMEEPEEIINILNRYFAQKQDFKGKKVLVSAGPTFESIDPVRFIGNHSSGKMGYAIAREFAARGASVELVSGPVNIKLEHGNVHITKVTSAEEMKKACLSYFNTADITVMAAAVADYTPANVAGEKIKKKDGALSIELKPTTDILAELGRRKNDNQILVGFALETENETENALSKLHKKNLDLIVLNSLKDEGAGFGFDTNRIKLIDKNENVTEFDLKSKKEVAKDIVDNISLIITDTVD
jgi:phosphopantothenoylcysteine decarboxylase/phosphopantothenate--cysteine ligase